MLYFTNPLSILIQIKVPNKLYQKYNLDSSEIIISPFLDCDILADSYIPLVLLDIPSHGVIVWRIGTNSKILFLVHFMIMSPLCQILPNVFKIFTFRHQTKNEWTCTCWHLHCHCDWCLPDFASNQLVLGMPQ